MTDANDNRPVFNVPSGGYVAHVFEDSPLGTQIITVTATDVDQGIHQSISYAILSNITGIEVPFEIADPSVSQIIMTALQLCSFSNS